jgi:hypothetical protein
MQILSCTCGNVQVNRTHCDLYQTKKEALFTIYINAKATDDWGMDDVIKYDDYP